MTVVSLPRTLRSGSSRLSPTEMFAVAVISVILLVCLFGAWITPTSPAAQHLLLARQPPGAGHVLGTDALGRDILARVIDGARLTVLGPLVAAACTLLIAIPLALVAAFRGGLIESIIMRGCDTLLAIPAMLVVIAVVGLFGGGYWLAVAVLIVLIAPGDVRLLRSVALGQLTLPYMESARTMGIRDRRQIFVHILPNMGATIAACFLLDFVNALLSLSALAFLGLGSPPGSTDWGTMLSENRTLIDLNPWAALAPAILLILTGFAVTAIGDWLHARFEEGAHVR